MQDVEYWDEKFQEEIDDLQKLINKAMPKQGGSQQKQTLDEADRKLRQANSTKRSYKFDLRLVSNSTQRKSYEKVLISLIAYICFVSYLNFSIGPHVWLAVLRLFMKILLTRFLSHLSILTATQTT